jgi:glycosidase
VLWQLNARTTVRALGPTATLDDIDGAVLDRLVPAGVDWLYLLGVWRTGAAGRAVSRTSPDIRRSCEEALGDLTDEDICGSCFAVTGYEVNERLGGADALARLRERVAQRGTSLMLDFVPNHTAPDHRWVAAHPDRYVAGTEDDLAATPANWTRVQTGAGERVLAYGRDPYFAGWPDTLQLDYAAPDVPVAMTGELLAAAGQCDGLRCDMAMLLLPDVFERTWGRAMAPFWPAALDAVRAEHPGFTFMAEVYWDREYDLQQQGFDITYDKRLYDRLVGDLAEVRGHLGAAPDFQARSARFLENHDEPRAATVFGEGDRHRAAAVITYLVPGLRFLEEGQPEACHIHVPVHLCRAPVEPERPALADLYADLFEVLAEPVVHDGSWQLTPAGAAWDGNESHTGIVSFTWSEPDGGPLRLIVVVNLADTWAQAYVGLPHPELAGRAISITDRFGPDTYVRDGDDLLAHGLYVDVRPWAHQVFAVTSS